jgi:hypothetical protein
MEYKMGRARGTHGEEKFVLVGKPERRPPRRKWEDNTKMNLK